MVSVTGNFTSRAPLHPEVLEAISRALADGWADPRKLSQSAHRAATLKAAALESIAASLGIATSALHIVGEPALLPYLAISGLVKPDTHLFYSAIDQGKIRACARAHQGPVEMLSVDSDGAIAQPPLISRSLLVIQAVNGETGISQNLSEFFDISENIVVDATHAIPDSQLIPPQGATILDATSWGGPQGLGFIALAQSEKYQYPLPHLADIKVPGSYSLPLLIGAAVALEKYHEYSAPRPALRQLLVQRLNNIDQLTVVAPHSPASPHYLSAVITGRSADELLRSLNAIGIDCDSGSACNPQDLAPSHVLHAMGISTEGHLRFRLHDGVSESDIAELVTGIGSVLN